MVVGIGVVAILGILGAAFQIRQMWLPRVLCACYGRRPPPLPLRCHRLHWDSARSIARDSCRSVGIATPRAVQHASDAVLEITEGGPLLTAIQLDTAHLQTGSFTYARTAEKVDVQLIVHQKNGPDLREVTSFLGKLPERKPVEDPAALSSARRWRSRRPN